MFLRETQVRYFAKDWNNYSLLIKSLVLSGWKWYPTTILHSVRLTNKCWNQSNIPHTMYNKLGLFTPKPANPKSNSYSYYFLTKPINGS